MRRALLLVFAVASLTACGGSQLVPHHHTTPQGIGIPLTFGVKGGNVAPFTITITAGGSVTGSGAAPRVTHPQLKPAAERALSDTVKSGLAGLSSRQCKGTLPDVGSRFIRAQGTTITVHGSCEPAFERLWGTLTRAVGFD